jgi:hypothetical protein
VVISWLYAYDIASFTRPGGGGGGGGPPPPPPPLNEALARELGVFMQTKCRGQCCSIPSQASFFVVVATHQGQADCVTPSACVRGNNYVFNCELHLTTSVYGMVKLKHTQRTNSKGLKMLGLVLFTPINHTYNWPYVFCPCTCTGSLLFMDLRANNSRM